MACLGPPSAALQPRSCSVVACRTFARPAGGSGGVPSRRRAAAAPLGNWADGMRLGRRLQMRRSAEQLAVGRAASGTSDTSRAAAAPKKHGVPPSPVPDVDAEQLLRSQGLHGTADPAALLTNLRKLPGVRQQGVLDNAAAVAAHLLSPAVGLTAQQAGQLLERCPELFSWPPEQRAAVLFGEMLSAEVTAAAAAACFMAYPEAVTRTTLAPGLAEAATILAHSEDRDSSLGGRRPKVAAAQRTMAALLTQRPSAVMLICQSAGYLQQRAAELQQAGFTTAQVAGLAWDLPDMLCTDGAAKVASRAAVLQQELGMSLAVVVSLVAKRKPRWLSNSVATLRARASALAEGFGQAAAAGMLIKRLYVVACDPMVWRRNLCVMAAFGVADPRAVLRQCPYLLLHDHAAPTFVQRRLMLQRCTQLTAAQLYEQHPRWLYHRKVPDLAQRLQFVEHCGSDMRQLMVYVLFEPLKDLLPAVGASQAEWEAWAAVNPPAACPLYRWAQQAAAEEAARLAATLPPELAQRERRLHSLTQRKQQAA